MFTSSILFINLHNFVSSANNIILDELICGISLTNNRNIRGPRIEPWGTPDVTLVQDDVDPLILTHCLRLFKKDDNHVIMESEILYNFSLWISNS